MTDSATATAAKPNPILFYKKNCPPCRRLASVAYALSLHALRRVPLEAAEAETFYRLHPEFEGMPVLVFGRRCAAGAGIFATLPRAVLGFWLSRVFKVWVQRAPAQPGQT